MSATAVRPHEVGGIGSRCWTKLGETVHLLPSGFLYESDILKVLGRGPKPIEEFSGARVLVLFGEPGLGKSTELSAYASRGRTDAAVSHQFVNLRGVASSEDTRERLDAALASWIDRQRPCCLWVDAVDEAQRVSSALEAWVASALTEMPRDLLQLRLACRTAEWPVGLEAQLVELWPDGVVKLELCPLRMSEARAYVAAEAPTVAWEELVEWLLTNGVAPLAARPITLRFLVDEFAAGRRVTSKWELFVAGCTKLAEELNTSRLDRRHQPSFVARTSPAQRILVAASASFLMLRTARLSVRVRSDLPVDRDAAVGVDDVLAAASGGVPGLTAEGVLEALESALFTGTTPGCVAPAHQAFNDFLAAYAVDMIAGDRKRVWQVLGLRTGTTIPTPLRESVAWLAGRRGDVFDALLADAPDVLVASDLAGTRPERRATVTRAWLEALSAGRASDSWTLGYRAYAGLGHASLRATLEPFINDRRFDVVVRITALQIINEADIRDAVDLAWDVARDATETPHLRAIAASAVRGAGDEAARRRLLSLARTTPEEDPEDELRGAALDAVFPDFIGWKDVLPLVTPPRSHTGGMYMAFLGKLRRTQIERVDLCRVLDWCVGNAEEEDLDDGDTPADEGVGSHALCTALRHLQDPDVLTRAARLALRRIDARRPIIELSPWDTYDPTWDPTQEQRLTLLLKIAELVNAREPMTWRVLATRPLLCVAADLPTMLAMVAPTDALARRRALCQAALRYLHSLDPALMSALRDRCASDPEMRELRDALDPSALARMSAELERQRLEVQEIDARKVAREQQAEVQAAKFPGYVREQLARAVGGDDEAWRRFCIALWRAPTLQHEEIVSDLSSGPGWAASGPPSIADVTRAATEYLHRHCPPDADAYITRNGQSYAGLAWFTALRWVYVRDPGMLERGDGALWRRAVVPVVGHVQEHARLPELTDLLRRVIDADPERARSALARRHAEFGIADIAASLVGFGDVELSRTILDLVAPLSGSVDGVALEPLLRSGYSGAWERAVACIGEVSLQDEVREARRIPCAEAALFADVRRAWPVIWAAIRGDTEFGKALWLAIGHRVDGKSAAVLEPLGEDELVDLFLWMTHHFPPDEDRSRLGVQSVSPRDQVGWIRGRLPPRIASRGTPTATAAIARLRAALPGDLYLKYLEAEARHEAVTAAWEPISPRDATRLLLDPRSRVVTGLADLVDVCVESIEAYAQQLRGHHPSVKDLWNEHGKRRARPKVEVDFSDHLARDLRRRLHDAGIVVNREVEVRPRRGMTPGERTDILVEATGSAGRPRLAVVIEVKGCWHRDARDALEKQLVEQYLVEEPTAAGVYVVGWFLCDAWEPKDLKRRGSRVFDTIDGARESLAAEAARYARPLRPVVSYVVDARLA